MSDQMKNQPYRDMTEAEKADAYARQHVQGLGQGVPEHARDPWAHCSKATSCSTCMFYVPKVTCGPKIRITIGRCRRHAPTMGGYPSVFETDWCGDHKIDEQKI